jgi:3-oxoacyl-(acyl-carrier-protein) synthase/NAD(P)-dependent dehydrogenase (short-subunit alcohol dehydrogenase family)
MRSVLDRLSVASPRIPVISNVTGDFYPRGVEEIKDLLVLQIASTVQWVKGTERLYSAGAQAFVEVGPKRTLKGFIDNILAHRHDAVSVSTNHPRGEGIPAFNQALCALYAAGYGAPAADREAVSVETVPAAQAATPAAATVASSTALATAAVDAAAVSQLNRLLAEAIQRLSGPSRGAYDRNEVPLGSIVISGTGLGLPGTGKAVMDPSNVDRILRGEQFIDLIPERLRREMAAKEVTRVVKSADGSGHFETIRDTADVIKLAARAGRFDLTAEYGVPAKLVEALDSCTQLAMAAGLDALREAGIPLVQTYRKTTTGKHLPDRWMLPESMRDETGVVFASAWPGLNSFSEDVERYHTYATRKARRDALEDLRRYASDAATLAEIQRRIVDLDDQLAREPYAFDRRFLLRVLCMGHSQFAEYVGARGPNTHVNSACASTAMGIALAEDWIRSGRCRRVVVLGGDNATSDTLFPWLGAGFLASGAAATDDKVEEAALPFDRRRHGMIIGMGACALVVESQDAVEERGMRGLVEVLATDGRSSAFHPTRLDVDHISQVLDSLITASERRFGLNRNVMAPETVFVSHETYTPARGGSASAEVMALRKTFGQRASEIVIANTKGFTGHPMGVGVEDVIAVKILEHGIVPPVPNFKEVDPELGVLTLSRGGRYPVKYAIHLAAGFGSQIAFTLLRRIPGGLDRIDHKAAYDRWLADVSGYDRPATEVMSRVLRIASQGAPSRLPAPSSWTLGLGPVRRAAAPGDGGGVAPLAVPAAVAPPPAVLASAPAQPAAPPGTKPLEAPPPPPPAAPSVAPAVATQKPAGDAVTERVLAIVAEKTGYPPEMLDPDLDLEADLGVDTVKQAETFAGVREAYAISRDENLKLRDFPTIRHVVKFVLDRRPDLAATAPAPAAPAAPPASLAPSPSLAPSTPAAPAAAPAAATPARPAMEAAPAPLDDVSAKVLAIIADKTGYPPDMLDMDLDLEADLGVDTVKQAETFAGVREAYDIPRDENLKLRDFPTIRHVVKFVLDRRPDLAAAPAAAAPAAPHLSLAPSAPVPTAAAPAPTVPVAAAMGAAPASLDDVSAKVLAIIADKTGYPPDMLDMDLDLEADLGVDTVKQAETFAGVREAYDISRDENLKLRDFPTIRHVVKFVLDRRPDLVAAPAIAAAVSAPVTAPRTTAPATSKPAVARLEDADRFPRRVPVPSLRPPIDLMKSTGVTLGKSSRVVVALDEGGVGTALRKKLESEGVSVLSVDKLLAAADLESAIRGWLAGGPIHGVFWLPALDVERALSEMDLAGFREANRVRVKNLAAAMRVLYDVIAGQGSFLVAATRMGGFHGQGGIPATAPLGGAVSGFAKAYKRERTSALVKVVDFPVGAKAGHVAESLVAEAQADPGVVEVGYRDGFRWTISLEERSAVDGRPGLSLGKDTVFIVTGAAGGITSAIVADLAGASGGTFYLLDRAPEPKRDDPRIQMLRADREGLKRALIEEAKARGERPLPPQIDKQILGIEREASALQAIEGVEAAGGTAHYRCVNLLDGAAVGSVVEEIRKGHGRVDALVHAGGIEISRALADKAQQEYDLVFDIKADGFFSLLKAAEGLPIGATVVFSSVAGRFGNSGQTDYSAANALLCSLSSHLEGLRPETRPIAIDWTAWGGIGMATRGSIPKIMEAAGIETLPPEVGIPTVRRELVAGGSKGELVVGGRLGIMGAEWDETGGLDAGKAAAHLASLKRPLLMVSAVKGAPLYGGLTVETTLDPNVQPFLFDHQMEGLPLLPGVMGTETFAEAAAILCPGAAVLAVEDEEFLRPFKYYRMQPATFHVSAVGRPAGDGEVVVDAQLKALIQPKPDVPAQEKLHFRARVRLGRKAAERPSTSFKKPASKSLTIGRDAIYKVYFHGPAYRVLDRVKVEGDAAVGLMAGDLPVDTVPAKAELLMAPRLLELCFQTAGIWEVKTNHVLALPAGLESVTAHRRLQDAEGRHLYAVVTARSGRYDAKVVDDKGDVYLELVGYRTVPLEGRQTIEE